MKIILYPVIAALLAAASVVIYSMAGSVHQYEHMIHTKKTKQSVTPGNMADTIKNRDIP
jgi:hypothetical protein